MTALPDEAFAAALTCIPGLGFRRIAALLRRHTPVEAWDVVTGRRPAGGAIGVLASDAAVAARWRETATPALLELVWRRCRAGGIDVLHLGGSGHPAVLDGPEPAPVLFVRGDRQLFHDGRRVAIVGTRNATAAGKEAARRIAAGLADAGVHVVSGLARGIDGWAHRAVVDWGGPGRPIGVVASGPDVVYPREHRELWARVATDGLLVSEAPPGTAPESWRFPMRNRIIAALAEVVVVVESRERGGSLITSTAASDRGIPVMAVPGGVNCPAAAGTNELLRTGAAPVLDASDVLLALELDHTRAVPQLVETRSRPRPGDVSVYEACAREPRQLDGIVLAVGGELVEVAMAVARLVHDGWFAETDGWYEAIGAPLR